MSVCNMRTRFEPQQHFEAACCNIKAHVTVAIVSSMSVCKICPRLKPQQHFEVACSNGKTDVAEVVVSYILGASHGGLRRVFINEDTQRGLNLN